jgi:hypothetical protein
MPSDSGNSAGSHPVSGGLILNRKKIGVTLMVCAILASGLVAAGMVATNGIATDGSSDTLSIDSGISSQTLNVTVYADVQGQIVPIQGANVTVYEVTETSNETTETISIEKFAEGSTGVGGVAQILLPEGNYTVVADYYGLRSVGVLSGDTNGNITMVLSTMGYGHGCSQSSRSGQAAENNATLIHVD